MAYRTIDAAAAWRGDNKALEVFTRAYDIDCKGDDDTFRRVYGWTQKALDLAKARTFGLPDPADTLS